MSHRVAGPNYLCTMASQALLAHIPIPPKLLVSLIVLGLALIIWAIVAIARSGSKKNAPPQQMQQFPPGPPCPTCGTPGRWIPQSNGWGCDRCRQMIPPPPAPPPAMMPPA